MLLSALPYHLLLLLKKTNTINWMFYSQVSVLKRQLLNLFKVGTINWLCWTYCMYSLHAIHTSLLAGYLCILVTVCCFCSHIIVACSSLKLVLKTYSPLIRQNLAPPNRLGVDITGEERCVCLEFIFERVVCSRLINSQLEPVCLCY